MIPVSAQPEPVKFHALVRAKGLRYLAKRGIPRTRILPRDTTLAPYWRDCLDELHSAYHGVCAYLCVFIERVTGGSTVEHFVAKSRRADQAYEWTNYRLACSTMNSRKRDYDDVLDPFHIEQGWFHLELVSGRIYPNPRLSAEQELAIQDTIDRLGLDDPLCKEMRVRHFDDYLRGDCSDGLLRRRSPFVWYEANRQGLL
jgi:uncharacterized protein (TIGR02646 family)